MMIRPASRDDLVSLDALERSVFGVLPYPGFFFRQALDLWPEWLLVAGNDAGLAGYALAAPASEPGTAWVLSVAVRDVARGQGVGGQLIHALLGVLRAKGCARVRLTVHPDSAARALYERFGFRRTGFEADYFGPGEPRALLELDLR